MKALIWFLRGVLFFLLLGLAIKNSHEVELRFFFETSWRAPLSLVVLVSIVIGVVLGLLALLPKLFQQRRGLGRLERELAEHAAPLDAADERPALTRR
ncbi:MAG: LapA family protein [Rhodocyclaceae bacterium]|nr:LapA family protein [Rhodocyclaceae bacterium]